MRSNCCCCATYSGMPRCAPRNLKFIDSRVSRPMTSASLGRQCRAPNSGEPRQIKVLFRLGGGPLWKMVLEQLYVRFPVCSETDCPVDTHWRVIVPTRQKNATQVACAWPHACAVAHARRPRRRAGAARTRRGATARLDVRGRPYLVEYVDSTLARQAEPRHRV